MEFLKTLVAVLGCVVTLSASAQWQWLDNSGNKVFSDRAPPADIPAKNILKQPGGTPKTVPAAAPQTAASAPGLKPKISGVDKELEQKKKQAEDAEAAQKKAEADKLAVAKAENCNRARQAKSTYDSGMRIARTNDKGEREILDDNARAAEVKRAQDLISSDCS